MPGSKSPTGHAGLQTSRSLWLGWPPALHDPIQRADLRTFPSWRMRRVSAPGFAEYDVPQRQLRGNLPQAFVHALLLECSARLAGHSGAG